MYIAKKIADIKGLPVEEVAKTTYQNAMSIFGIIQILIQKWEYIKNNGKKIVRSTKNKSTFIALFFKFF